MTNRGKPRPMTPPADKRNYDVVARLRTGALGDFDDAAVARSRALKRVHAAAKAATDAAALMDSAVAYAREQGLSWDAIGAASDTQGETVRRRHSSS
jgi:hypothetical protein